MKKQVKLLLCVLLVASILVTGCQEVKEDVNKGEKTKATEQVKNEEVTKEFKEAITMLNAVKDYKMPYFGGYTMKDKQVVFFSEGNDKAVVWNHGLTGQTKVINKSDIAEDKRMSSFADGKLSGIDTIYVMHENPKMAFILAIHEGYHFYGQAWVNKLPTQGYIPRGTVYPENVEARVFMNEADHQLRSYMEGKNPKGREHALYFINQALLKHPDDVQGNLSTAIAEGTANFVENLYLALATFPELKGDDQAIAGKAYALNKENIKASMHEKSSEYYHVSSLPLYYLAMQGHHDQIDALKKGGHPLLLLKSMVKEESTALTPSLKAEVSKFYENSNKLAGGFIEDYKAKAKDKAYQLIKIPMDAFPGSMQFGEFINYKVGDNYHTLNTMTSANGSLKGGSAIALTNVNLVTGSDYQYYEAYVKVADINKEDGKVSIDNGEISLKNANFTMSDNAMILE